MSQYVFLNSRAELLWGENVFSSHLTNWIFKKFNGQTCKTIYMTDFKGLSNQVVNSYLFSSLTFLLIDCKIYLNFNLTVSRVFCSFYDMHFPRPK